MEHILGSYSFVYMYAMVVYQPKRIKFGIIARSRAYGQFGCLVSTCQNCQTSFQNSYLKRKSFHNKRCSTSKNKSKLLNTFLKNSDVISFNFDRHRKVRIMSIY